MDKQVLDEIYRFWFGEVADPEDIDPRRSEFWMRGGEVVDRQIREKFGHRIAEAAARQWDIDSLSRQQCVALVVVFDQFPRNVYRTSGDAFGCDHLARDVARQLVARGIESFTAAERFMIGLTFVHHEDLADQDHAVMLAAAEAVRTTGRTRDGNRFSLDQAIRHRAVIQRFGRFPHRNAMLGRESTPEELEFMAGAVNGRGF